MHCAKFGWKCLSGFWEEDENVKIYEDSNDDDNK